MGRMLVSLIQMNVEAGCPEKNRSTALKLIERAAETNPDVIIMPEMWNTGYSFDSLKSICDRNGDPTLPMVKGLARETGINIIAGSVADMRDDRVYNTSYIVGRKGEVISQYSKIHLFGLMEEDRFLSPGEELGLFRLDDISCGILICYDLRFPELMRSLALKGARVVFVPAQWPFPRQEHWVTLLRARAIENQLYVVAANRVGRSGRDSFFGRSMVVDPWGEVIAQAGDKECIVNVKIDLGLVDDVRNRIPVFSDRREDLY
ncbi:MAG: Aliphatic amidase AmiE [Firmicutes bacterium]|nr:Aliphatic amidase AmiE [Bacillota bacterium]MDI6706863.1 carbon-nitrogen family hydrolase [Bacillota bacterium]